ncbi:hypothetical protein E2C01_021861 [Portunus trituberculatus]|uniref:Uncharacterized protein n=1 Tax=Portunus trituberculatus TaxID=210409 RepID=A0A5B7E3Q5_PORTR|nr:hypothetical protein [Portunus trituberculatus]
MEPEIESILLEQIGFQLLAKAVKFNSFTSAPPGSTHGAADGRKRRLEFFVLESMHLSALRSLVNLRSKPEALKICHRSLLPTTAHLNLLNAGTPLVHAVSAWTLYHELWVQLDGFIDTSKGL